MDLSGQAVVLYGRFRLRPRQAVAKAAMAAGARVQSDLTRRASLFVVGAGALNFVASGHLPTRLAEMRRRGCPALSEARFVDLLAGAAGPAATFPLDRLGPLDRGLVDLLNGFDLIRLNGEACRFGDAGTLRDAHALAEEHPPAAIVEILLRRQAAPAGRHRLVTGGDGTPLLQWEDGVTTLEGQGVLDLGEEPSVDALFEAAMEAEAEADWPLAERLYGLCMRADRSDPVAPFNRGNVLLALGNLDEAALDYRVALARDPGFADAHYNLGRVAEKRGALGEAQRHLREALRIDPSYQDALFNLAQLELEAGRLGEARSLFQRFLGTGPEEGWARKARSALTLTDGSARG